MHMKHTRWPASGPSTHATKLLKNRHQRFYGNRIKERKEHNPPVRLTELIPSAAPVTITTRQATDESTNVYITIKLLGKVIMELHAPGGIIHAVPLPVNPKTILLLASIAWKRGGTLKRSKLIYDIWEIERTEEETTEKILGWAFDGALKALRAAIREAIKELNCKFGKVLLDPKMDIFEHRNQLWWLSSHCRVTDLETVEAQYQVIIKAKKSGALFNLISEDVKSACDALIDAYTGDFLEGVIQHYPVDQVSWADNWIRVPITHYRDYYLDALWYAAEYECQASQCFADKPSPSETVSGGKQRECWGRAAEYYKRYAMYACNNELDTKVYFCLPNRGDGERVTKSEEALRLCVKQYGKLGKSDLVDKTYNDYYDLMRSISNENWEPSEKTLREVLTAREYADIYRLEE